MLRHLLTHTSGLHNYTEHPDFMARVIHFIAPADLVAWFRDDPPDFAPGAEFRYSNTNYVLLGQIVEKVSGASYGDYLRKTFFDPIGMHDTGVWDTAHPPDRGANGYSYEQGKLQPAINWDMSWAVARAASIPPPPIFGNGPRRCRAATFFPPQDWRRC